MFLYKDIATVLEVQPLFSIIESIIKATEMYQLPEVPQYGREKEASHRRGIFS